MSAGNDMSLSDVNFDVDLDHLFKLGVTVGFIFTAAANVPVVKAQ